MSFDFWKSNVCLSTKKACLDSGSVEIHFFHWITTSSMSML